LASSSATDLWDEIAEAAARESALWSESLLPSHDRERVAVFSPLGEQRFAVGVETIYEGYLVHYGRSRLFAAPDEDKALLLGDYLYAEGLARIARLDSVAAIADLAELISLCAKLRGDRRADGDGEAWAATVARLGRGELGAAREALRERADAEPLAALARRSAGVEAVDGALAAHRLRLG
jgi:hypothetical protein